MELEPYRELSVEDDFVVGTVPLDLFEALEPLGGVLTDLELVFLRRNSLKNGIV